MDWIEKSVYIRLAMPAVNVSGFIILMKYDKGKHFLLWWIVLNKTKNTKPIKKVNKVRLDLLLTQCCIRSCTAVFDLFIHSWLCLFASVCAQSSCVVFAADVKRVWGFEGLRRASVSRVKRRDLWRSNVALYANRRGLFVALCLVDVSKAVEVCAGFGYTSVSVIEALKAVYGRETQATSLRADKPHGLDAQKETNECCGFGIRFLLENRF